MTDECWDNITELEKLPGFHGVIKSFEQFSRDWHEWYVTTQPENMPLVGEWNDNCNEFQRMLFIRSLRPDRFQFCANQYITNTLGQRFIEPPVLDIKAVFDESLPQTPLIFVLSPGVDPTNQLVNLADTLDMTDKFLQLSLGQGQAPIATRMILEGMKEGYWIYLANCHLSLSWMPALDKLVENLLVEKVHDQFRLWLSSSPTPEFPLSILQAGIKMTTEPPKVAARRYEIPIDTLSWEFSVFTHMNEAAVAEKPEIGVYIQGTFLEGGGWNLKKSCLEEPEPMKLIYNMPLIHFKPAEIIKKRTKGIYSCPCYYFPIREGMSGKSAFVIAVDLKSGDKTSDHWIKRGTALLLSLAN